MKDCIFCKIAAHEAPSTIELENDLVIAIKNIAPVAEIHVLIMPKKHIDSVLSIENGEVMAGLTHAAQTLIKKYQIEGGYKLVFNGGKYQAIPHVHWHLLGGEMSDLKDPINKT